jgi:tRNA (mo5U34)-methyltransferase
VPLSSPALLIEDLTADIGRHVDRLRDARSAIGDGIAWYPYDILANLIHVDTMLSGPNRDLGRLAAGRPVADIGAADGDLAFTVEDHWGWEMDIVDNAPSNMNRLDGARALRDQLGSKASIHDIDLDTQFQLPRERYGLIFLLGILYHLQNPYYVLRELAGRADHVLLSTKVARFAGPSSTPIADLPVGYLVSPTETNNDPTNYWVLSPAGLERLVDRTGWDVLDRLNVGNTTSSDPATPEGDEREFMLLRSRL